MRPAIVLSVLALTACSTNRPDQVTLTDAELNDPARFNAAFGKPDKVTRTVLSDPVEDTITGLTLARFDNGSYAKMYYSGPTPAGTWVVHSGETTVEMHFAQGRLVSVVQRPSDPTP